MTGRVVGLLPRVGNCEINANLAVGKFRDNWVCVLRTLTMLESLQSIAPSGHFYDVYDFLIESTSISKLSPPLGGIPHAEVINRPAKIQSHRSNVHPTYRPIEERNTTAVGRKGNGTREQSRGAGHGPGKPLAPYPSSAGIDSLRTSPTFMPRHPWSCGVRIKFRQKKQLVGPQGYVATQRQQKGWQACCGPPNP